MSGETDLSKLIEGMNPKLNEGDYVFATVRNTESINWEEVQGMFKENESTTIIIEKNKADALGLVYEFIASWITLSVHSSLEAVGLTALFSNKLAGHNISCNVVAGYYHDHIFVAKKDAQKAMKILTTLAKGSATKGSKVS